MHAVSCSHQIRTCHTLLDLGFPKNSLRANKIKACIPIVATGPPHDRFVSATDRERRYALEHSTTMNDGYQVLRDPMARAGYMLTLLGLDVADDRAVQLSSEFLITILEVRESLEELTGPDAHVERRRIQQSIVLEYEEGLARLGGRLDSDSGIPVETLKVLGQLYAQMKYLRRVLEEIERLEAEGDTPESGNLVRLDPLRPETFERKGT